MLKILLQAMVNFRATTEAIRPTLHDVIMARHGMASDEIVNEVSVLSC